MDKEAGRSMSYSDPLRTDAAVLGDYLRPLQKDHHSATFLPHS